MSETPITLRGITWDHPRGYRPLAASVDTYAAKTGVHVTWDRRSLKDFGDAPIDALAEDYDLLVIDHPHVGMAVETGCLLPLDQCLDASTLAVLADQSAGPSHDSYAYDGHQWALALDAAMQTSVCRPDLFDHALPASWAGVLELGARLQETDRRMAIPLVPTDCICSFLTLCANLGDPPGRAGQLMSEAVGQAALHWLADVAGVCHASSLAWNPIQMLDHMSQFDDVVYSPLTFCYSNYSRAGYAPKLLQFVDIPGVAGSLLGGAGFAVSARCPHPAAACAYGAWLCSAETQRTFYVEQGGQPGNRLAWTDDDANWLANNVFHNTLGTLEQAYVRPRHPGFVTFQEAAGNVIHDFLRAQGSVEVTLNGLRQLYQQHAPDDTD